MPVCNVNISFLVKRTDNINAALVARKAYKFLFRLQHDIVHNRKFSR